MSHKVSHDNPEGRRKKDRVCWKIELGVCCLKFCSVQLDLLLEVGIGFQEGILEFDQMLLAKPGIYYLKQFILETVCHILALKKAKHLEAEGNTFQGINIYQ